MFLHAGTAMSIMWHSLVFSLCTIISGLLCGTFLSVIMYISHSTFIPSVVVVSSVRGLPTTLVLPYWGHVVCSSVCIYRSGCVCTYIVSHKAFCSPPRCDALFRPLLYTACISHPYRSPRSYSWGVWLQVSALELHRGGSQFQNVVLGCWAIFSTAPHRC